MNESSRPLRVLLVGLGEAGESWASALAGPEAAEMGVVLSAVCEMDRVRGEAVLRRMDCSVPLFERILDALVPVARGATDLMPDLVIDTTTANARLSISGEALKAGVHVLCEKPLAADEETAALLASASAHRGGRLAVNQTHRFQPGLRQLRALVATGTLGRPQTLRVSLHTAPRPDALRRAMRHSALRLIGTDAFDAARAILGCEARAVMAIERTPENQPFGHAPEAHALFEMANGALFSFYGNWADAGPATHPNGAWQMTLSGGAARWVGTGSAEAWEHAPKGSQGAVQTLHPHPLPPAPPAHTDLLGSLEETVRAIREKRPPETHARDNATSLAMVFAAIRSARKEGQREPVRPLGDTVDATALVLPWRTTLR